MLIIMELANVSQNKNYKMFYIRKFILIFALANIFLTKVYPQGLEDVQSTKIEYSIGGSILSNFVLKRPGKLVIKRIFQ